MSHDPLPKTCEVLLAQLRRSPADHAVWDEFVRRYGRHIYRWCRRWGLQDADAEDLTQDILLKLSRKLYVFVYDPSRSFRAWLKTVAHNAWRDYADGRHRQPRAAGDGRGAEPLHTLTAREDPAREPHEGFDLDLLEAAAVRVRRRVAPHTWEAFRLVAIERRPAVEVAERVRLRVAMVYVAKSKVQKLLRQEIKRLNAESDEQKSPPGTARQGLVPVVSHSHRLRT